MGKQTKTITRVSQVTGTTRLRKLFFSFGNLILIFFCIVFFFVSETFNSQMMMKLILILGLLVATAHCGTEHRRAARAETARSETMSREAGVVNSDSNSWQSSRISNHQNCFFGWKYPCKWSDTYRLQASYGCGILERCWHQCVASMRGMYGGNALDTSGRWCWSSKDYNGGFFDEEYIECQTNEDCAKKVVGRSCAGPCKREI